MTNEHLVKYIYKEVPDNLFTRNELKYMGAVPINPKEPDAIVYYPVEKREYNLYDIEKSRQTKKQKVRGIS